MLFNLRYSFVIIFLTPTNIYSHSSVVTSEANSKFANDTEEKDIRHLGETGHISSVELSEQNVSAEESNEKSGQEQVDVSNDLFRNSHVPLTKSSSEIPFDPDSALPQQVETDSDLKQESSSQSHEFEFKESSETDLNRPERDFISHSPSTIKLKTTHQVYTEQKSEIYQSSGSEDTLSTPESQRKHRTDEKNLQHLSSEEPQISQTHEPVDILLGPDKTERIFTEVDKETISNQTGESFSSELPSSFGLKSLEQSGSNRNINEETLLKENTGSIELNPKVRTEVEDGFEFNEEPRLDQTDKSFFRELTSTIKFKSMEQSETDGIIHDGTILELTRERPTREMAGNNELNIKEPMEVGDGFTLSEDIHLNQTVDSFMRDSTGSNESKPVKQAELEDNLESISQNGLRENSDIIENDIEKSAQKSEISNLNSQEESKLAFEPFQQKNNNSGDKLSNGIGLFQDAALPKQKATVKENFVPSNNADNIYLDGNAEDSENLQIRNIDSEYIAHNTSYTSKTENDDLVETPKQLDYLNIINHQLESLILKDRYDENNSDEIKANKRNQREFNTCEKADCLDTATSTDFESADFNSELIPKIQKDRIRAVGRVLANAMNSKLLLNDSSHKENQSAFEYLENIEFNLQEVVNIIKTDSNVRAVILNIIILYIPVLICDVFLWIVIVKLVRHIRRFLVSNKQPGPAQSLLIQENELKDADRLISSSINPNEKSGKYYEDILDSDSSPEFSEQKVWYPPI